MKIEELGFAVDLRFAFVIDLIFSPFFTFPSQILRVL